MRKMARVIIYTLWTIVLFDVILALVIGAWQVPASAQLLVFAVVLWLLVSLGIAGGGLALVYRRSVTGSAGWVLIGALMTLSWVNIQGIIRIPEPRLSLLLSLLFPFVVGALFSAISIVLYQHDVGLRLIAMITLVDIWGLFLVWKVSGNFVEQIFTNLTTGHVTVIQVLNLLFCMSTLLLFLAALSIAWHTIKLIHREVTA